MTGTSPADGIALTGWILTCAQDDEQASRVGRPGLCMSSIAITSVPPRLACARLAMHNARRRRQRAGVCSLPANTGGRGLRLVA